MHCLHTIGLRVHVIHLHSTYHDLSQSYCSGVVASAINLQKDGDSDTTFARDLVER
ncbi:hypothetical protein D3C76_314340 [compost metagenome]